MRSPVRTRSVNGVAEALLMHAEARGTSQKVERKRWLKKAGRACLVALRQGRAYPPGLPEAMMLMGTAKWLNRRRIAARRWWERSLRTAERMGVRYDQARTHLEMGRRLGDPAQLRKAERLFAESEASWELSIVRECLGSIPKQNAT